MRKLIGALLLVLCVSSAAAQEAVVEPLLPPQESAAFVEAMFRAASGVTFKGEWDYRDGMTLEQRLARNDECADYRARTLPWLEYALLPYPEEEAQPTPSPTPEHTPAPDAEMQVEYTTGDSYAAFMENELGRAFLAQLAAVGGTDEESALELSRRVTQEWMAQIDHAMLREMNTDYLLWIYAPGTQIDYPVVQDDGNEYYLNHLFNGKRNASGTLFLDYRNLPQLLATTTLIYGHHMRNDSMFGTLTDYEDQEYFEANPYLLIFNDREIALLEVFAGYVTDSSDHCYNLAISGEEEMTYFIRKAEQKSNFNSGVDVTHLDRIVTLSTCAYAFEHARYVVLARINSIWNNAEPEGPSLLTQ